MGKENSQDATNKVTNDHKARQKAWLDSAKNHAQKKFNPLAAKKEGKKSPIAGAMKKAIAKKLPGGDLLPAEKNKKEGSSKLKKATEGALGSGSKEQKGQEGAKGKSLGKLSPLANPLSARKENPFTEGGEKKKGALDKASSAGSKVGKAAGKTAGASAGAYVGSVIPVLGTALGKVLGQKLGGLVGSKAGGSKIFILGTIFNFILLAFAAFFILMLPAVAVAAVFEEGGAPGKVLRSLSCGTAKDLAPSPAKEILDMSCEEVNEIGEAIGEETIKEISEAGHTEELRQALDCSSFSPGSRKPYSEENKSDWNCVEGLLNPEGAYWSPVPKRAEWLVPVWQKAANRYGLDWKLLAAVNATRTYYGSRNCSSEAKGSGGGEGFYRLSTGLHDEYGVNAGKTKVTEGAINCKKSAEPAEMFSSSNKALSEKAMTREKSSDASNAYDAVDATFTTAKVLAAYGAYGEKEWDYSGSPAGACTVDNSDGRINYVPAAAAGSGSGVMGFNSKLEIPQWAGVLAAKYTYKKGDPKTARYKPRRDTPDTNRSPIPQKDLVKLLTVVWQAFGKKGGELKAAVEANYKQIGRESGGRPYILQGYIGDVNDNNPAGGLMQFIPETFETWKVAGFNNRFNPLDNILATVNAQVNASSIAGAGPGNILDGRSGWSPVMGPKGNPYAKGGKVEKVSGSAAAAAKPGKEIKYKGQEQKDAVSEAVRRHGGGASECYVAVVNGWYEAIKENPPSAATVSGDEMRERILEIAREELAKTPRENGGDNMPKYNSGSGDLAPYHISGGPWCAAFATWVWREAGVKIEASAYSGYPIEWGGKKGLVKKDNPEPGDFVIYDAEGDGAFTDHIGIVEKVKNGKMLTAIEGNYSDGVVRRTSFTTPVYRYVSPAGKPTEGGPGGAGKDSSQGAFVPCPKKIPQDTGNPCYVDNRIIPDLLWIHKKYKIYITDGYSGPLPRSKAAGCYASGSQCHALDGEHPIGLGIDIAPAPGKSWDSIDRLARWAEPNPDNPIKPFRWVGYNGDAAHGRGHHLHLSWDHSVPTKPYKPAEWVLTMKGGKEGLNEGGNGQGAASGASADKPKIVIDHIPYGSDRKRQMAAYSKKRYGQSSWKLSPKQIVLHFTSAGSLESNRNYFASNTPYKGEAPGVCAHYFVGQDGKIVEVVPTNIRCRHTIGLNHVAVGIEFVETSAAGVLGNKKQLSAGRKLVSWLQGRHSIDNNNVLGHAQANNSSFYKEKTGQRNDHGDWTSSEVKKFKKGL